MGCGCCKPGNKAEVTTTLKIGGMTCGHCVNAVKTALETVPGVKSAEVDLESGKAVVKHSADPGILADLVKAVADAGYEASV